MLLRSLFIISISLLLGACSDDTLEARQALEESLGLHSGLEFMNMQTFPGGVVCGEYSVSTPNLETLADQQPFFSVRGKLYKQPRDRDWAFFCSEASADVLLQNYGIGPYDSDNVDLARISADLSALDISLESYYKDHYFFPTAEQGLEALVSPPANLASAARYPEGGYLEAVPRDPWGRPYLYEEEQWGRTKGHFTITTLGADGLEGGVGPNADVSTTVLPYLRHIAVILGQQ